MTTASTKVRSPPAAAKLSRQFSYAVTVSLEKSPAIALRNRVFNPGTSQRYVGPYSSLMNLVHSQPSSSTLPPSIFTLTVRLILRETHTLTSSLVEVLDEDLDEDRNPSTPPGLAAFAHETPEMPVQVPNSAARVETRALLALNSAAGLPIDYLTSLHRLLQHCKYCDTVGLPAAMRDHIRTGACRRFIFEAEDHDN